MSKSNLFYLCRFGRTRALIFTQKWLNRATPSKKLKWPKINFFGTIIKKNSSFRESNSQGKMSHFVAFFVHFDKLIRPHPGPLCPPTSQIQLTSCDKLLSFWLCEYNCVFPRILLVFCDTLLWFWSFVTLWLKPDIGIHKRVSQWWYCGKGCFYVRKHINVKLCI